MKTTCLTLLVLGAASLNSLLGAELKLSIGIRETGGSGPIFANGGSTGGIEWVNRDAQTLLLDGTWQLFSFTPATDPLVAFAGATANSVLDTDWVTLEHLRILNSGANTGPIRLWIDNITTTNNTGVHTESFETFGLGTEVIFQEPSFSGSTLANLLGGSSALVSDSDAFDGVQSNEANFQFVDADPTRWVRLTTSNTPNLPNPLLQARDPGYPNPTITFYAKAILVPEPAA
jgi:hypothetical protein